MLKEYDTSGPGKFEGEPPMARFLFERVMLNGDFGDDGYSDGEGTWGNRYGRRVIEGDDRGFVWYVKFDTADEAATAFRSIAEQYEGDLWETELDAIAD